MAHSIYNQLKHKPTIYHSDILEASLIKSRESIIKGRWKRLPTNYVGQFCLLKTNCQMVSPTFCDNDVSFSISCHNNWQFLKGKKNSSLRQTNKRDRRLKLKMNSSDRFSFYRLDCIRTMSPLQNSWWNDNDFTHVMRLKATMRGQGNLCPGSKCLYVSDGVTR